ncbi:hypothetical protein CI610_02709 [invertebrate metagenome]|uniref:Uncharacterized protein n=1 Tax=invertebrate metagenome TaxID=1711999 RepID=A0A2H9T563_9ZZZZ
MMKMRKQTLVIGINFFYKDIRDQLASRLIILKYKEGDLYDIIYRISENNVFWFIPLYGNKLN